MLPLATRFVLFFLGYTSKVMLYHCQIANITKSEVKFNVTFSILVEGFASSFLKLWSPFSCTLLSLKKLVGYNFVKMS